jgi:hypothetical protein
MKSNSDKSKEPRYIKVFHEVARRTDINSTDKLILSQIKGYGGNCFERYCTIAELIGMSEDSVSKSIKKLLKIGDLKRDEVPTVVRAARFPKKTNRIRKIRKQLEHTPTTVVSNPTPFDSDTNPVGKATTPVGQIPNRVESKDPESPMKTGLLLNTELKTQLSKETNTSKDSLLTTELNKTTNPISLKERAERIVAEMKERERKEREEYGLPSRSYGSDSSYNNYSQNGISTNFTDVSGDSKSNTTSPTDASGPSAHDSGDGGSAAASGSDDDFNRLFN